MLIDSVDPLGLVRVVCSGAMHSTVFVSEGLDKEGERELSVIGVFIYLELYRKGGKKSCLEYIILENYISVEKVELGFFFL